MMTTRGIRSRGGVGLYPRLTTTTRGIRSRGGVGLYHRLTTTTHLHPAADQNPSLAPFVASLPLHRILALPKNFTTPRDEEEVPPSALSAASAIPAANAMVGPRSWLGGLFNRSGNKRGEKTIDYTLTPLQEQKLQKLQERLNVPFDETRPDHQEALKALWHASFPDTDLKGLVSEQWKDMGWQGPNPSTDFRGCGFVSLENLLFFARTYPASFQRILFKQEGMRAAWEYPFAVAGINVSFMLIQMLDLYSAKPKSLPGINFTRILSEDEEAFDVLYCIAFQMMDAQWLAMRASYLQFKEVLQATRTQLERELSLEDIHRIQDLPAYNLLYK